MEESSTIENYCNFAERILKIAVILGGHIYPEERKEIIEGKKPRVDAMEMELKFPAQLFDFYWLEKDSRNNNTTKLLFWFAKYFKDWSSILAFRVFPEIIKYDVVFATGEDVGLPLASFLRFVPGNKTKIILRIEQTIRGRTPFRQWVYKFMLGFAIRKIDIIFTRTQAHADYLKKNFQASKTIVSFFPETVDTKFFNHTEINNNQSIKNFISEPYIMSAGLEMRDYESLISAVHGLPMKLIICAGSPWAKVRLNRGNDIPENVIIRSFNRTEMLELYRMASLVVIPLKPTTRACGANVLLEAWASRRAVIISRTEGLLSYIRDQEDGYFVTPGDIDDLRSMIRYLLDNPCEANRIGNNGYQRVNRDFFMERYLQKIKETITQIT